jgi:hypothetical protein
MSVGLAIAERWSSDFIARLPVEYWRTGRAAMAA